MMDVLYKGKTLEGLWIEGVAFPHDNNILGCRIEIKQKSLPEISQ